MQNLEKEIEVLKERMVELAQYATPANYNEKKAKEYYSVLRLMNEKRNQLNSIPIITEAQPEVKKTFVNSFGEATNKYISTTTYERNQKKLENNVLRNLGR